MEAGAVQSKEEKNENLTNACRYPKTWRQADGARVFLVVPSDRMRSNAHELKYKKFHLNMRENFALSVAEPWNSCPVKLWSLPL